MARDRPMIPVSRTDPGARLALALSKPLFLLAAAPDTPVIPLAAALNATGAVAVGGNGHFTDALAVPLKDVLSGYNDSHDGVAAFTQADFRQLMRTAVGLSLARLPGMEDARALGTTVTVHAHNLDFLDLLFPSMAVVHVVCDGRGLLPTGDGADAAAQAAAHVWADAVGTACRFGASRPERSYEIRLEDLSGPDSAVHWQSLLRFLLGNAAGESTPRPLPPPPAPTVAEGAALARMAPLLRQFDYL